MNIHIYSNIHTVFITNIYSDIPLCQISYMNIFGYLFVLKFLRMSHSELVILVNLVLLRNLMILVILLNWVIVVRDDRICRFG